MGAWALDGMWQVVFIVRILVQLEDARGETASRGRGIGVGSWCGVDD